LIKLADLVVVSELTHDTNYCRRKLKLGDYLTKLWRRRRRRRGRKEEEDEEDEDEEEEERLFARIHEHARTLGESRPPLSRHGGLPCRT